MARANKAELDFRILSFNTGRIKDVLPTQDEYHLLSKAKKKKYYKLCKEENPSLYYDPEEHVANCRLPTLFTCNVNGC